MTTRYPILFEAEATGAVSAYVPDLPVYAAANTAEEAERAIRDVLAYYLSDRQAKGLPLPAPRTIVKVARISATALQSTVAIVSSAALLGRERSPRKAAAARRNWLQGGRTVARHDRPPLVGNAENPQSRAPDPPPSAPGGSHDPHNGADFVKGLVPQSVVMVAVRQPTGKPTRTPLRHSCFVGWRLLRVSTG